MPWKERGGSESWILDGGWEPSTSTWAQERGVLPPLAVSRAGQLSQQGPGCRRQLREGSGGAGAGVRGRAQGCRGGSGGAGAGVQGPGEWEVERKPSPTSPLTVLKP